MAFKKTIGGVNGDFWNVADFFGSQDDAVVGTQEVGIFAYRINTYSGHDIIDLLDCAFGITTTILGGSGDDTVLGGGGADTSLISLETTFMYSVGGADTLAGDEGADTLVGGSGNDAIWNPDDDARDIIRYLAYDDSSTGVVRGETDRIEMFREGGGANTDRIDLSRLDARLRTAQNDAFVFRGEGAFTSAKGEIRVERSTDANDILKDVWNGIWVVCIDDDADATTEMTILVYDVVNFTAADFIL